MMSLPRSTARGDGATAATVGSSPGPDSPPTIDVVTLIGEGREAIILHRGERYRLRLTANDKLILTK
ncbi:hemin uptake protein HemP [Phreatobacter sp.]|uniref:hemin uptake protein HemP n=1 Tax=Phreatobacter sp. TaxID=1966341 RepID=UPI003F6FF527